MVTRDRTRPPREAARKGALRGCEREGRKPVGWKVEKAQAQQTWSLAGRFLHSHRRTWASCEMVRVMVGRACARLVGQCTSLAEGVMRVATVGSLIVVLATAGCGPEEDGGSSPPVAPSSAGSAGAGGESEGGWSPDACDYRDVEAYCPGGRSPEERDPPPERDPGCSNHFDCGVGEICVARACDGMFARPYRLTVVEGTLTERMEDGDSWDSLGGAPDPFVAVIINDETVGRTENCQDNRSCSYQTTFEVDLYQTDTLVVAMFDEDLAEHDYAGGWSWSGGNLQRLIKEGGASSSGGAVQSLVFSVSPR
jgi:hypothetical protein